LILEGFDFGVGMLMAPLGAMGEEIPKPAGARC
jgi:cytochrome bd-type quinol oxidase subunit 2